MKNVTKILLSLVLLSQISYSPKAQAIEWWEAALIGGVAAVATVAVLSATDKDGMNMSIRGGFRTDMNVGDRVPWQGQGGMRGYAEFDAMGSSADGRYQNCRRVRPVIYDNQNRPMDMRNYPPTCACLNNSTGHWTTIPSDQFVIRNNVVPPQQYAYNDNYGYGDIAPYGPFYSGRPLSPYVRPIPRPMPYPYQYPYYNVRPTPQYPQYQNNNDPFGLNLNMGVEVSF